MPRQLHPPADALAPTLAEAFAPKVLERLEQLTTGESAGKEQSPESRSSGPGPKVGNEVITARSDEGAGVRDRLSLEMGY